jgi:hypothetical protein
MPTGWENLDQFAERIGRCPGHVRKLCQVWRSAGKARLVEGNGKRPYWLVRVDADDVLRPSPECDKTPRGIAPSPGVKGVTTIYAPADAICIVIPAGSLGKDALKAIQTVFLASSK